MRLYLESTIMSNLINGSLALKFRSRKERRVPKTILIPYSDKWLVELVKKGVKIHKTKWVKISRRKIPIQFGDYILFICKNKISKCIDFEIYNQNI